MSMLHELKPHPKAHHRIKRVGRGVGSGVGKTSGRGHKGQHQHNKGPRPGFEGGQMPLIRTIPKRGFSRRAVAKFQVVNIADLAAQDTPAAIDAKWLYENNFISHKTMPVKILGDGAVKKALTIKAQAFSRSAVEKIEKAGGKCEKVSAA